MAQDLRYAMRQLRRSPGFFATAVVVLALGLFASTAISGRTHNLRVILVPSVIEGGHSAGAALRPKMIAKKGTKHSYLST
jgi:hypothetical protein